MRSARFWFSVSPILGIVAFVSCGPNFETVAARLDSVAAGIEEFGTISVSSPLLFRPEDAGRFKFSLDRTAQQYYEDSQKISGASGAFLQEAVDTQFGATFRFNYNDFLANRAMLSGYEEDLAAFRLRQNVQSAASLLNALAIATSQPTTQPSDVSEAQIAALASLLGVAPPSVIPPIPDLQSILLNQAAAANALGTAFPGPTSRPAFPTLQQNPPNLESPLPTSRPAQDVLVSKQFKDYQKLLDGRNLSHPSRSAIVTAAGDHLTQSILNFLVDPSEAAKFHGKRLYFAAMMVSVQPGDRTYRGYRADVSVKASFGCTKSSATRTILKAQDTIDRAYSALGKCNDFSVEKWQRNLANAELAVTVAGWAVEHVRRRCEDIPSLSGIASGLLGEVENLKLKLNNFRNLDVPRAEAVQALKGGISTTNPAAIKNMESLDIHALKGTLDVTKFEKTALDAALELGDQLRSAQDELSASKREFSSSLPERTSAIRSAAAGLSGNQEKDFDSLERVHPLVAAVSPMTDVQTLDLSSSIREQASYAIRLATALSGMGANLQAEFFQDWVRRLERDSRTLTNLNAVTSYSISGGVFGYQISPRLQALADPTGEDPEADMILQPITFPVLVILGVDERDLQVYDIDAIAFEQTSRWLRAGHPRRDKQFLGRTFDRWGKPRLSEMDMMRRAYELDEAERDLGSIECRSTHERTTALLTNRIETLGFLTNAATTNWQTLDTINLGKNPSFSDVKGKIKEEKMEGSDIALLGTDLDAIDLSKPIVIIPQVENLGVTAKLEGQFVKPTFNKSDDKEKLKLPDKLVLQFQHVDEYGGPVRHILSGEIEVERAPDKKPKFEAIFPNHVVSSQAATTHNFIVAGENLDKLFKDKAADFTFYLNDNPKELDAPILRGGVMVFSHLVEPSQETKLLQFVIKDKNDKPADRKTLHELPRVFILPQSKDMTTIIRETTKSTATGIDRGTERLTFPKDEVDEKTIRRFLESLKECQSSNADVSVSVTATDNSKK